MSNFRNILNNKSRHGREIVLFDFTEWEITLRELIFSIFIVGIMFLIGFFISENITKSVNDRILKYRQAAQISTPDEVLHAYNTDVGWAYVQSSFDAVDPVKNEHLEGEYMRIVENYQHLTMHTQVYTVYDQKGRPHTRIRTYWSWDTVRTSSTNSQNVVFSGVTLPYSSISFGGASGGSRIHEIDMNDRIVISYMDKRQTGTFFHNLTKKHKSRNIIVHCGRTIEELYKSDTKSYANIVFWTIWSIFTIFVVLIFYVMENEWLEDKNV